VFPGRIKYDAQAFFDAVSASGSVTMDARAAAGLPDVAAARRSRAARAARRPRPASRPRSTRSKVVDCNFVVPLFSRDAAADITDGLTDSGSTYTIDSINAYVNDHCLEMSKITERKNRQAVLSKRGTFKQAKDAAKTLAAARMNLAFQDVMSVGTSGLAQFQPWMNAVEAASMQAAAGPKAIFNKVLNINGAVQNAKDFNPKSSTQVREALKAGLLHQEGQRLPLHQRTRPRTRRTRTRSGTRCRPSTPPTRWR
jgi:hypothetical protein